MQIVPRVSIVPLVEEELQATVLWSRLLIGAGRRAGQPPSRAHGGGGTGCARADPGSPGDTRAVPRACAHAPTGALARRALAYWFGQ
jgi:hypothetical protein